MLSLDLGFLLSLGLSLSLSFSGSLDFCLSLSLGLSLSSGGFFSSSLFLALDFTPEILTLLDWLSLLDLSPGFNLLLLFGLNLGLLLLLLFGLNLGLLLLLLLGLNLDLLLLSNLDGLLLLSLTIGARSSVFVWVVDVSEVIGVLMVFPDEWLLELVWISVLLVLWCWFETSWMSWPVLAFGKFLGLRWSSSILLLVVVVSCFLVWVIEMMNIVMIEMVLIEESLSQLRWDLVLLILWCWFETSWVSWPDLGALLSVSTGGLVLIWVVYVNEVIGVLMVLPKEWLKELVGISVLLVLWCWLESSWVSWPDLGALLSISM